MTRLEFNNQVLLLSRKLYTTAFRFLKRQEEAEDAVQEVFIRLWNRLDELDRYNSLEAFAVTTVKNYCIDLLRREKLQGYGEESTALHIVNNEPSPHEKLENDETASILNRIIRELPELYREIITLKEIDGLSYEEIAETTNQNINTLRVNLSRARKIIRDEYKKRRYEHTGSIQSSGKVL